ncbi:hypothetical protein [Streptosporangium sp. CA-115845]|uniref:hypothetical protein n=1 Tax=Streptosporangium sp. CA-115845 TaxID=3240071 RepID=UPI003D90BAEB
MSEQTSTKPPLPSGMYDPFPRIAVDESEDSPFRRVLRLGVGVADNWMLGPDGPYKKPGQTGADITRAQVREALLHLLELGFIDIDVERLMAAPGYPLQREAAPAALPLGEEA